MANIAFENTKSGQKTRLENISECSVTLLLIVAAGLVAVALGEYFKSYLFFVIGLIILAFWLILSYKRIEVLNRETKSNGRKLRTMLN